VGLARLKPSLFYRLFVFSGRNTLIFLEAFGKIAYFVEPAFVSSFGYVSVIEFHFVAGVLYPYSVYVVGGGVTRKLFEETAKICFVYAGCVGKFCKNYLLSVIGFDFLK